MKPGWVSVVGQLIGQVLRECLGSPEHVRSDNYVCPCVCVYLCGLLRWEVALSPNCCLLSHCQSDYEILFNLLGGRVLCDFDESDLLFLHSLYCLVVRCCAFVRSSVLGVGTHVNRTATYNSVKTTLIEMLFNVCKCTEAYCCQFTLLPVYYNKKLSCF